MPLRTIRIASYAAPFCDDHAVASWDHRSVRSAPFAVDLEHRVARLEVSKAELLGRQDPRRRARRCETQVLDLLRIEAEGTEEVDDRMGRRDDGGDRDRLSRLSRADAQDERARLRFLGERRACAKDDDRHRDDDDELGHEARPRNGHRNVYSLRASLPEAGSERVEELVSSGLRKRHAQRAHG